MSFRRSVVSTKCRLDEVSFDEVSFRRSVVSTKCRLDEVSFRRNVFRRSVFRRSDFRRTVGTPYLHYVLPCTHITEEVNWN